MCKGVCSLTDAAVLNPSGISSFDPHLSVLIHRRSCTQSFAYRALTHLSWCLSSLLGSKTSKEAFFSLLSLPFHRVGSPIYQAPRLVRRLHCLNSKRTTLRYIIPNQASRSVPKVLSYRRLDGRISPSTNSPISSMLSQYMAQATCESIY